MSTWISLNIFVQRKKFFTWYQGTSATYYAHEIIKRLLTSHLYIAQILQQYNGSSSLKQRFCEKKSYANSRMRTLRHSDWDLLAWTLPTLQLGSVRCKHIEWWQHFSPTKTRLLRLARNVLSPIKTQQAVRPPTSLWSLIENILLWMSNRSLEDQLKTWKRRKL